MKAPKAFILFLVIFLASLFHFSYNVIYLPGSSIVFLRAWDQVYKRAQNKQRGASEWAREANEQAYTHYYSLFCIWSLAHSFLTRIQIHVSQAHEHVFTWDIFRPECVPAIGLLRIPVYPKDGRTHFSRSTFCPSVLLSIRLSVRPSVHSQMKRDVVNSLLKDVIDESWPLLKVLRCFPSNQM